MEFDKKHLLYIGGAVASIGALYFYLRSRKQQMPVTAATGPQAAPLSGGGAGADAMNAAQLQAATALAIEQGREQTAIQIATLQARTALGVTGAQAYTAAQAQRSATARTGIAAGAGLLGAPAGGGQSNFSKLLEQLFGLFQGGGGGIPVGYGGTIYESPIGPEIPGGYGGTIYNEPIGPSVPEGWTYNPLSGSWENGAVDESGYATTTGGGSSDWFGGDVGMWDTGAYPDYSGGGGGGGYGDEIYVM